MEEKLDKPFKTQGRTPDFDSRKPVKTMGPKPFPTQDDGGGSQGHPAKPKQSVVMRYIER